MIKVLRFWASGRALIRESPVTELSGISRCRSCLQVRVRNAILEASKSALQAMMALSSVYFDRRRCIFNACRLTGRSAVVVSNVVHSLWEDSRRVFHCLETAKQILMKSELCNWKKNDRVGERTYTLSRIRRFCRIRWANSKGRYANGSRHFPGSWLLRNLSNID